MTFTLIKNLGLFAFFFFSFSKSYSQTLTDLYASKEWFYATKNRKGQVFFIKANFIYKNGSRIKIWTRSVDPVLNIDGKIYRNVVVDVLYEFDCNSMETKTYLGVIKDSEGNSLETLKPENPDWEESIPDSVGEGLIMATCEHFKKH